MGKAPNGWRNPLHEPLKGKEGVLEVGGVFEWQLKHSLQGLNFGRPFLSLLRKIAVRYYYNTDPNNGLRHIAWTNLYKIAPDAKDNFPGRKDLNPDYSERRTQLELCEAILKKEIEILSPKYVVFITGWEWVKDFSVVRTMPTDAGQITTENWIQKKNRPPLGVKKWVVNDISYILCDRPEGTSYGNLVNAIDKLMQGYVSFPIISNRNSH